MSRRFAILYADGSLNVFSTKEIGGRPALEHARHEWCPDEGETLVTFDLPDEAIVPYLARAS